MNSKYFLLALGLMGCDMQSEAEHVIISIGQGRFDVSGLGIERRVPPTDTITYPDRIGHDALFQFADGCEVFALERGGEIVDATAIWNLYVERPAAVAIQVLSITVADALENASEIMQCAIENGYTFNQSVYSDMAYNVADRYFDEDFIVEEFQRNSELTPVQRRPIMLFRMKGGTVLINLSLSAIGDNYDDFESVLNSRTALDYSVIYDEG